MNPPAQLPQVAQGGSLERGMARTPLLPPTPGSSNTQEACPTQIPPGHAEATPVVEPPKPPEPVVKLGPPKVTTIPVPFANEQYGDTASIFGKEKKMLPEQLILFPYSPEGPIYSLHKRVSKQQEGLRANALETTIPVVLGAAHTASQSEKLLLPVPSGNEEIALVLGSQPERRGAGAETIKVVVSRVQEGSTSKLVAKDPKTGNIIAVLSPNKPVVLGSLSHVVTEAIRITEYPDHREPTKTEVIGKKEEDKDPKKQCVLTPVVASDGREFLLVEAGEDPIAFSVPETLSRRATNELAPRREIAGGEGTIGFMTRSDERHPARNEDVFAFHGPSQTFILCDGMGGEGQEGDGYRASRIASAVIKSVLDTMSKNPSAQDVEKLFHEAITLANTALHDNLKTGGGTTVVLAKMIGNKLVYAKVGDSRLSVLGKDRFVFETQDDSMLDSWEKAAAQNDGWVPLKFNFDRFIQQKYGGDVLNFKNDAMRYGYDIQLRNGAVQARINEHWQVEKIRYALDNVADEGLLDPIERYAFSIRNAVTAAVGSENDLLRIDSGVCPVAMEKGYRMVITSDGVHDVLSGLQRVRLLRDIQAKSPKDQASALVNFAEAVSTATYIDPKNEFHKFALEGEKTRRKPDDRTSVVYVYS